MPARSDPRVVMTLDAGGTNFRFLAISGHRPVTPTIALPSNGDDLDRCLANLIEGFERIRAQCPRPPVAISFAFPGPADYPNGIIGDLYNLPAFRGGVALGPLLQRRFRIPAFINNDGDLFVYGEAIAGFLPYVNGLLRKAGNPKRYQNLFGVTLGTGFGGGIVRNGEVFVGDNSSASEIWLLRNRLEPHTHAEDIASIRGVRRIYARNSGLDPATVPEPKVIFEIASGRHAGDAAAAREAFRQLGQVVGDAIGEALTLVDGLAVIGGGLSGAWPLFLPSLIQELSGTYTTADGSEVRRIPAFVFNLEDSAQRRKFLKGSVRKIAVPGSRQKVNYDPMPRVGVGLSRLGTSEAVGIGAYAFALRQLDRG